ncbi:ETS-related transcription factor Elf-5 isoform X2 [Orussus abietinus]|uniref:ETS-related transcription factor Elf-5 isoform X2 n=1 Tax=Orussus abietinus TaxID=222816 RepID=UPI0006260C08|nr:ETS-related transcription factor Elf-5 isoform X2 [Orussus abietinus]
MSAFLSNYINEMSEVYSAFAILNRDETDHIIMDMDSIALQQNSLPVPGMYEATHKKFSLGDDLFDDEVIDSAGWFDKPIRDWSQEETINWLMSAATHMEQPYSSIQNSLAIPGRDLIALSRDNFIAHDPVYGERLYDLLHSQYASNLLPPFDTIAPLSEDEFTRVNSSSISDAESENSVELSTRRASGRPRGYKQKKAPKGQGKLWEFIRDLLRNRETCPSLICWEDYSQAKFRFVRSDEVAKRWGSRKGNTKMTYEKLSRAMRYYYKSKIFLPVLGRRLVYQFGPNAKGWQTDNPNFRQ